MLSFDKLIISLLTIRNGDLVSKSCSMIYPEQIRLDGSVNSVNGIRYRYSKTTHSMSFYGVSFLVGNIPYRKMSVKVTMHADVNHERPHIHVGNHEASFDIKNGTLIVGECDNSIHKEVQRWIERHRDDLLELWSIIKEGRDRSGTIEKIRKN